MTIVRLMSLVLGDSNSRVQCMIVRVELFELLLTASMRDAKARKFAGDFRTLLLQTRRRVRARKARVRNRSIALLTSWR